MRTIERKVTTLVPYRLPGDSALLRAKFECDSARNVLLKSVEEAKYDMESRLQFSDGILDYRVESMQDTVWLPYDSVFVETEIPILVEVTKIEYRQTKWQMLRATVGDIALAALAMFGIWRVIKIRFKIF